MGRDEQGGQENQNGWSHADVPRSRQGCPSLRESSAWVHLLLDENPRYGAGTELTLSAVGKSFGIVSVTLPVAAHSLPRSKPVRNPTQRTDSSPWPIGVW